jgi:hypothetical protein
VFESILLLLYINNLPLNIKEARTVLFANDTNILITAEKGQNLQKERNNVLSELDGWLNANSLILNTAKKKIAMAFHKIQERDFMIPQITFGKTEIAYRKRNF